MTEREGTLNFRISPARPLRFCAELALLAIGAGFFGAIGLRLGGVFVDAIVAQLAIALRFGSGAA